MAATAIATVFLDRELRITRYTPSAGRLFNLIPTDIGRPLADLTHRLDYPRSSATPARARRLVPVEREVHAGGAGSSRACCRTAPSTTASPASC